VETLNEGPAEIAVPFYFQRLELLYLPVAPIFLNFLQYHRMAPRDPGTADFNQSFPPGNSDRILKIHY
jgi:hypothetical protein